MFLGTKHISILSNISLLSLNNYSVMAFFFDERWRLLAVLLFLSSFAFAFWGPIAIKFKKALRVFQYHDIIASHNIQCSVSKYHSNALLQNIIPMLCFKMYMLYFKIYFWFSVSKYIPMLCFKISFQCSVSNYTFNALFQTILQIVQMLHIFVQMGFLEIKTYHFRSATKIYNHVPIL